MATARVQQPQDFGEDNSREVSTPEIVEGSGTLAVLNASEINQQIATAKRFPRSISKFREGAFELITTDEETAAMCIYALPRGKERDPETGAWEKKIIKGPSARFAELIGHAWGNCRIGTHVIGEDENFVIAQGYFYDLEKNVAIAFENRRRITDRDGNRYSADMIAVTANAAASIALRNAVLKGVPKVYWKGLYAAAERTIVGTNETMLDRRQKLFDLFKPFALTVPQLCKLLGVGGSSEVGGDQLVTLRGILTSLQEGETTVERLFSELAGTDDRLGARAGRSVEDIKRQYSTEAARSVNPQSPQTQENPDAEPAPEKTAATSTTSSAQLFDQPQHRSPSSSKSSASKSGATGSDSKRKLDAKKDEEPW
jgi:hypothetical protein